MSMVGRVWCFVFLTLLCVDLGHCAAANSKTSSSKAPSSKTSGFKAASSKAASSKPESLQDRHGALQQKIQDYLNGLKTLSAKFLQINASGREVFGTLYMKRPDKMRIEYEPGFPQLVIARGDILYFHDLTDDSVSTYTTSSTPAGFILQKRILFNKDMHVRDLKIDDEHHIAHMTLTPDSDGDGPSITLTFRTKPFLALDKWVVLDGQGNATTVQFIPKTLRIGTDIDDKKFQK